MSGSVTATEGLDPETAAERVDTILGIMAREVREHDGRIDRFLGDGLLALFGTPRAREDDPLRAVSAGLEIVEAIQALGMDATVGINTGEVYVGRIGSDAHREFSAMGPVINLASRFQSAARPGEVIVGASTYRAARRSFAFDARTFAIKGMTRPVPGYVVLRPLHRPERARGIEGMRASLTGRDEEISRLEAALAEATDGSARVVSVVGEAGVGKSRLLEEFERRVGRRTESGTGPSIQWLEGRCFESRISTPYAPFVDLLREYFAIAPADTLATRSARIASVVSDLADRGFVPVARQDDVVSLLVHMLSPGDEGDSLREASAEQIKNRTCIAVRDVLVAIAREQPLVLTFEDLHWSDTLSLELVQILVEALGDLPALLLLVYRPERLHRSRRLERFATDRAGDRYIRIELTELDSENSGRLLDSLLAADALPDRLRHTILERAQGNPLFLEEMLRSLIDSGVVRRVTGGWSAEPDAAAVDVPDTVQAIVLSRVDRLDEPVRRLLQIAAVIGRAFPRALLGDLIGDDEELERALWQLEQVDLVHLERLLPEEEYSFKHVLARDAVYGSLLRSRRAALHRAVARAIEARYGERLEEQLESLAAHYDRAGAPVEAVNYLFAAGEKARRAYLNDDAIAYLERARTRLASLTADPGERIPGVTRAEILESLGDVHDLTANGELALGAYRDALAALPETSAVARARLLRKTARLHRLAQKTDDAHATLAEAVAALGDSDGDEPIWHERIEIELEKMELLYFTAPDDALAAVVDAHRTLIERHGDPHQRSRFFTRLAQCRYRQERYDFSDETVATTRIALAEIEQTENLAQIGDAQFGVGFGNLWAGHLDEAGRYLADALETAERIGDAVLQSRCLAYSAMLERRRGNVGRARARARGTLQAAEQSAMREYLAAGHAHLAWAAWREGDLDAAERHANESLVLWRDLAGPYVILAWMPVWPLLGVAISRSETADALAHARFLLDPARQALPAELAEALAQLVDALERGEDVAIAESFEHVSRLARGPGYL